MPITIICMLMLVAFPVILQAQVQWLPRTGMAGVMATSVAVDSSGGVVAITYRSNNTWAVQRFAEGSWTTLSGAENGFPLAPAVTLNSIACSPDGGIVIGARGSVLRLPAIDGVWQRYDPVDSEYSYRDCRSVAVDQNQNVWIQALAKLVVWRDTVNGIVIERVSRSRQEVWRLTESSLELTDHLDSATGDASQLHVSNTGAVSLAYRGRDRTFRVKRVDSILPIRVISLENADSSDYASPTVLGYATDNTIYIGTESIVVDNRLMRSRVVKVDPTSNVGQVVYEATALSYVNSIVPEDRGGLLAGVSDGNYEIAGLYHIGREQTRRIDLQTLVGAGGTPYLNWVSAVIPSGDSVVCATGEGIIILRSLPTRVGNLDRLARAESAALYPNPTNGLITIELPASVQAGDHVADITLSHVDGSVFSCEWVTAGSPNILQADIGNLPSGRFLIHIRTQRGYVYTANAIMVR